ncbi:MAG TPA: hypothetical protein VFM15_08515, partial [Gammaproteobacteria bacterium]|nr:hypothetical protein [Gammaproteobacteria bacterium]
GLLVSPHGYRFYLYDGVRWQPITDDTTFHARSLGDDVSLELHLEGDPITLAKAADAVGDDPDNGNDENELAKPQIALLASGEITPFEIVVTDTVDTAARYTVSGSLSKGISLRTPDSTDAH